METFSALLAICAGNSPGINGWVNKDEAGDLRRHRAHYDVIVMQDLIGLGGSCRYQVEVMIKSRYWPEAMTNNIMTWNIWREVTSWLMMASRYQINALNDEYATDPFWNKDPQVTNPSIKSGSNYIPCFMSVVFATLPCNTWKFISLYDTN